MASNREGDEISHDDLEGGVIVNTDKLPRKNADRTSVLTATYLCERNETTSAYTLNCAAGDEDGEVSS